MQVRIAVMRRHLTSATSGVALCEIFEAELTRCHAASQNQTSIAIIWHDVIVRLHLDRDRRQRLMTHSGNVKVSFTLTIQILFAQVCMATLQYYSQKPQLIFLA